MKIRVTSENYRQEVLESDIPVLVEFFADWCSKCAMMEDTVDLVAANCGGCFKVCQIEIEDSADLAEQFQVEIGGPGYDTGGDRTGNFRVSWKKLFCVFFVTSGNMG